MFDVVATSLQPNWFAMMQQQEHACDHEKKTVKSFQHVVIAVIPTSTSNSPTDPGFAWQDRRYSILDLENSNSLGWLGEALVQDMTPRPTKQVKPPA